MDFADKVSDAIDAIEAEVTRASRIHGSFNSAHEGFAIIREELDELWDAVKANDLDHAVKEAVQVGAMAARFIIDLRRA